MPPDRLPDGKSTKPLTIADAKEHCDGVQVHCLSCSNFTVLGFENFRDTAVIAELSKRHKFVCTRCGHSLAETRPNYNIKDGQRAWYGLTKREND